VQARFLREGDELLYDLRVDSLTARGCGGPNFEQMPLVEDGFAALFAVGRGSRVTASHHDFHGDAVFCEREVDVVHPTRQLLPVLDACGLEKVCELSLARSDTNLFFKAQLRSLQHGFGRMFAAAYCLMGGGDLAQTLAPAHAGPFNSLLLRSSAAFDGGLCENRRDYSTASFEPFRKREDAVSEHIAFNHPAFRWDRVLDVWYGTFSGLAFDASTATGIYNNAGYVVKNCRCAFVPAGKYAKDALPMLLRDGDMKAVSAALTLMLHRNDYDTALLALRCLAKDTGVSILVAHAHVYDALGVLIDRVRNR
jgi:hypothetical protein